MVGLRRREKKGQVSLFYPQAVDDAAAGYRAMDFRLEGRILLPEPGGPSLAISVTSVVLNQGMRLGFSNILLH
jgi:hypothetical protein